MTNYGRSDSDLHTEAASARQKHDATVNAVLTVDH